MDEKSLKCSEKCKYEHLQVFTQQTPSAEKDHVIQLKAPEQLLN